MMIGTRFLSAAAALAFLAVPAVAEDAVQDIGGWIVTTRTQSGQKLEPVCLLASPAAGVEPRLQLVNWAASDPVTGRGAARIDLIVPQAQFAGGAETLSSAEFSVPDQKDWGQVEAKWIKMNDTYGSVFAVLEESVDDIIQPLARGNTFEVKVSAEGEEETTIAIDLTGSGRALGAYEECLAKVRASE